jgi:hypothetical protein
MNGLLHTTARKDVIEVTFIPDGFSEPETNRHPADDFDGPPEDQVDYILARYDRAEQEVISIIYITPSGGNVNLYGSRRYGL